MFLIGCASLVYPLAFRVTVGHVAYFAAIITASSLLYYYCSEGAKIDKMIFILIFSDWIILGSFKVLWIFYHISGHRDILREHKSSEAQFQDNSDSRIKLAAMVLASWKKMVMYFGVG